MAQRLADLVSRLCADVPPLSGVPDPSQAADAVKDAVAELTDRAPAARSVTVSVQRGTAAYALPADFLRLRSISGLPAYGSLIVAAEGLIPMGGATSARDSERFTVDGGQLTISPTPAYTLTRDLAYDAAYLLDENDVYPLLSDALGRVVLLKARANALRLQATFTARQAWQYQQGDERVSKEKLSAALREQATDFDGQFAAAVARVQQGGGNGTVTPYGSRARVTL